MSVTLNEAALRFLLEDEAGPTGLDLRRRSENVTTIYRQNVAKVLPSFFEHGGDVAYEIETTDDGLRSTIGIRPGGGSGRMGSYLAAKVEREPEKALDALSQGLHT